VPVTVAVLSLVMSSLSDGPLSEPATRSGADGAAGVPVSMVTTSPDETVLTLPAVSIARAVSVWLPSASTEVVIV
jgi:hypothetical protein